MAGQLAMTVEVLAIEFLLLLRLGSGNTEMKDASVEFSKSLNYQKFHAASNEDDTINIKFKYLRGRHTGHHQIFLDRPKVPCNHRLGGRNVKFPTLDFGPNNLVIRDNSL